MLEPLFQESTDKMEKSLKILREDLSRQRTGRASPDLLANVMVSYYGKDTPLCQAASIIVESALMLIVKPWDKKLMPLIQTAILKADLGLNPTPSADVLRVPLPALTEERRKELIKKTRAEGEHAKVSVRNIRRDANHAVKALLKDKSITEDEEVRMEDRIQKLTDQFIAEIDKVLAEKERELMEI